jgi:hypothetical protein
MGRAAVVMHVKINVLSLVHVDLRSSGVCLLALAMDAYRPA